MDGAPTHKGIDLFLGGGKLAAHLVNNFARGNALKVTTKNAIPMNVWTHVFVTYDGSSKASGVRVYLDGRPQEVTTDIDKLTDSIKAAAPPGDRSARELHVADERV
jgi:hypothetical protein